MARDLFKKSVYGVGFLGGVVHKPNVNGVHSKKYRTWQSMIQRCYSDNFHSITSVYNDCSVCDEWKNFQNFGDWFDCNYIDGYQLDKDIKVKGNKIYSPSTCLFVSHADNTIEAHAKNHFFNSPDGVLVEIFNLRAYCRDNGLNRASMANVHLGKKAYYKGWTKASK